MRKMFLLLSFLMLAQPASAQNPSVMIVGATPIVNGVNGNCEINNNGVLGEGSCGAGGGGITLGTTTITGGATGQVLYDNAGKAGEYTQSGLTAYINTVTSSLAGTIPAWPNNIDEYWRGDGTYAALDFGNPTATAGPTAINGTSNKPMRSDAAPAIQISSTTQYGISECDGVTLFCLSGVNSINLTENNDWTPNGAASTAGMEFTGALYTGGSGTTTFPYLYINQGTAPTTWSTSGTMFGFNAPSGFSGNYMDFHLNGGASVISLGSNGAVTATGYNATNTGNAYTHRVSNTGGSITDTFGNTSTASAAYYQMIFANGTSPPNSLEGWINLYSSGYGTTALQNALVMGDAAGKLGWSNNGTLVFDCGITNSGACTNSTLNYLTGLLTGSTTQSKYLCLNSSNEVVSNSVQCLGPAHFYTGGETYSTTSTSLVQSGFGAQCALTPSESGNVMVTFVGYLTNTTGSGGNPVLVQPTYGTGTAPSAGAAITGTSFGQEIEAAASGASSPLAYPFSAVIDLQGLTIGTTYWFDTALARGNTSSGSSEIFLSCAGHEY